MAYDIVDLTLARKVLRDVVVVLILLYTEITFHGGIKPRSIEQRGSSWELTDLQPSRKIGDVTRNAEQYNWPNCPPEVVVTLIDSLKTQTFYILPINDLWSLECILYHLLFCSSLCNVDIQQINILLHVFIYHCIHLFSMFMLLILSFLVIFKNY